MTGLAGSGRSRESKKPARWPRRSSDDCRVIVDPKQSVGSARWLACRRRLTSSWDTGARTRHRSFTGSCLAPTSWSQTSRSKRHPICRVGMGSSLVGQLLCRRSGPDRHPGRIGLPRASQRSLLALLGDHLSDRHHMALAGLYSGTERQALLIGRGEAFGYGFSALLWLAVMALKSCPIVAHVELR